jgi:putative flippase GtrA
MPPSHRHRTGRMLDSAAPKLHRLLARVLRYGLVGLVISILYSILVILAITRLHMRDATEASALAFAMVLPIAYLAHRYVTFSDAPRDPFQPWRFAVTTVSTFLVAIGGMYMVTDRLGHSYLVGIALNWVLIPAGNFLIYLVWVFRSDNRPTEVAPLQSVKAGEATERS